jgi:tRNA(Ile)-lysidine synthase
VNGFLQRIEREISTRQLFLPGEKILVAVSGGADSMVLLHALNSLAKKNQWKISVAHFNHQLRGRASNADKKLVRQTAKKLRLKFFTERGYVKNFARQNKISIEMAARKMRHAFFARVAQKQKIKKIALAHHADDQVELFFLRLLRGAGGEGLAGMKTLSSSPVDKQILLARPLLIFQKHEILEFARENKIQFRDDATNFSRDFLRNRIRNELLPLLKKKYSPAIAKTVLRAMQIVGVESDFANQAAQEWLTQPNIAFEKLPRALQRKILHQQLLDFEISADFELIEQLRQSPEKFVSVNSDLAVVRNATGEILRRENFHAQKFPDRQLKMNLHEQKFCEFDGKKFSWKIQTQKKIQLPKKTSRGKNFPKQKLPSQEIFDADKIGDEIILRHWRAGDRFQPIGFSSAIKLQDFFTNEKIPRARRHELILATTLTGEIFWVESLRISENFKLTPKTRRQLIWDWQ